MEKSASCNAVMPATAALNPGMVVMQGTDLDTAAVLIKKPSCREPRPSGVLITSCTIPLVIISLDESLSDAGSEFFLTFAIVR